MKPEDVTIVIPSLVPGKHELSHKALNLCLSSIYESFPKGIVRPDVILAFNGLGKVDPNELASATKPTIGMVRGDFPLSWPRWISEEEQGQCLSTNEAVKLVDTPWVFISNNDMIFPPGWFEKFTDVVDNFGLLVASPNLVEPKKGAPPFIEKFCGGVGTIGVDPDFKKECFLEFVEGYKEHENRPMENVIEDGFNLPLIIRKDVWDTIGGYDEVYDPWGSNSDSDLQYKLMLAGITPKRVKSTLVYHFSNTSGTFHPDHQANWNENWEYFKEKWGVERASSPEIWYKPEIDWDNVTYSPDWKGKYETQD